MNDPKQTPSDQIISNVRLRLLDPLGKNIEGLKYQVRDGQKIVAKGITDAQGVIEAFSSSIGRLLTVHVQRFGAEEMKAIKTIVPWAEDFRLKLVSGKVKDKLNAEKDQGTPGSYKRKTYKVRKGDTLGRIAPKYGTTAVALAKLNGIAVTDTIYPDQLLKVPAVPEGGHSPTPTGTPATTPASAAQAAPAAPAGPVKEKEAPSDDTGTEAEPGPAKVAPPTAPVDTKKDKDRGEHGTPKTSVSPVCDQSGCIKLGAKGQLVEELNIRLMGFGNTVQHPAPLDEFTAATERAVKQFQRDYMGAAETGRACIATLVAMDEMQKKFPLSYNGLACQCHAHNPGTQGCTGFGMARLDSNSVGHLKNGKNIPGIERPGIHRALFWSLRAALFYLHEKEAGLGYRFSHISSGYRCWKRAKQMNIFTTNHHGNAIDAHFKRASNGSHVDGAALDTLKNKVFVAHMRARPTWDTPNRISLEPTTMTDRWVHMDVREFKPAYRLDRHYAKTREAADGDELVIMAKREGRFGLLNCGGIAAAGPAKPKPVSAPVPAATPASNPTPRKPPANPPPKSVPTNPGAPAKPPAPGPSSAKAGPASPSRQNADTLDVSPLGLDFIREWESGSLTKNHLNPYNDNKGFCTIGVGHLIDGKRSCAILKSAGSKSYIKYEAGITVPQENALFAADVKRIVNSTLPSIQVPLHQHEFDALMSLAFNTGGLTKFKKMLAKLNTGDYSGCCDEFADITNHGDKGLVDRRKSEMKLFRNNVYDAKH
jgi:GH24 family phage-related lysozyme (muramidase)/LysM repeat protein